MRSVSEAVITGDCLSPITGSSPVHFANYRGVAQFGRASALGAEGHEFESCHPDHYELTTGRLMGRQRTHNPFRENDEQVRFLPRGPAWVCVGIGIQSRLKISRPQGIEGSNPSRPTI